MAHPPAESEHAHGTTPDEHAHPTPRTYVIIALILLAITIAEVFVLYVPSTEEGFGLTAFRPLLIPLLLILSASKFVLVVGFYMHLKFDDAFYLRVFGFALMIALTIATAVIALFHGIYL